MPHIKEGPENCSGPAFTIFIAKEMQDQVNTKHRDRVFLWMILPAFAGFVLLFIVPTLMSFAYSVTNWSVYNPELRFVGLKNFANLFSDEKTMAAIGHSIKYSILITVI